MAVAEAADAGFAGADGFVVAFEGGEVAGELGLDPGGCWGDAGGLPGPAYAAETAEGVCDPVEAFDERAGGVGLPG